MRTLGDEQRAFGVRDVPGQFRAPPRRVDAHHGGPGARGGAEPQRELRDVAQENTDVRLGAARQQVGQQRRAGGGCGRDLVAAEPPLPVQQSGAVIAPLTLDELRHGAPHAAAP
jgi:hypothetical protein